MTGINRRGAIAGTIAGISVLSLGTVGHAFQPVDRFVRRQGIGFVRDGATYRIVGANMWYAAWLGADTDYGDRGRLLRELDRLQSIGVNNLRIMAAAEEGPLRNSIRPGFTREDGGENRALFEGLDFALAEIGKRGMTAVVALSNFWEWSGGLQTILGRVTGGPYVDNGDPAAPWPAFADATAAFYANAEARALYDRHLDAIVGRTNTITGKSYRDDPAIMSWQLANEPRPGGSDAMIAATSDAYFDWIDASFARIRSLDPNHLLSLGQEGTMATNGSEAIVRRAHAGADYLTAHIWPLNWSWVAGDDLAGTWANGKAKTEDYIAVHQRLAAQAGKPLVIEEFGFPRDGEEYAPDVPTAFRQQFYSVIYKAVEQSWAASGPLAGSNFWAWNGEARAKHDDFRFVNGDGAYMGDPPHEPQGWYGNFDTDTAMLDLIKSHAATAATHASKDKS